MSSKDCPCHEKSAAEAEETLHLPRKMMSSKDDFLQHRSRTPSASLTSWSSNILSQEEKMLRLPRKMHHV